MTTTAEKIACEWYVLCMNDSAGVVSHPILNFVPTCEDCAAKHDLTIIPWTQIEVIRDAR